MARTMYCCTELGETPSRRAISIRQSVQLRQQEGRTRLRRQAVEQSVQLRQGLHLLGLNHGRRRIGFGNRGQIGLIGVFQRRVALMIDHQPLGDDGQQSPGIANTHRLAALDDTNKHILREVFGMMRAPQLATQPAKQPRPMFSIKALRLRGGATVTMT